MAGQTVIISVLADTKKFADGMSATGKQAGGLSTAMKGIGVAAVAGLAIAGAAMVGFIATSIKAAGESEKIAAQTNAAIASTGMAAGRTAEQVSDLALRLSRVSGIDDEAIQSASNLLLTFTQIKGVNFDAATKAALDMSVALGTDLGSAATLVGKALNDPIKGMSALSRVGVALTDDQKALIESLVAVGDTAGAQAVILGELNTQFGGSAEAFGNTYLGSIERVKNAFGNIQELVGGAFLPVLTQVFGKVAGVLESVADSPAFAAFLTNFTSWVTGLLSGQSAIGSLIPQLAGLLSFFSPIGLIIKVLSPLLPVLADAFMQIGTTLASALLPILPVLSGLLQQVVGVLSGAFAAILPVLIPIIIQLATVFADIAAAVLPAVMAIITALLPIITQLAEFLTQVFVAIAPLLGSLGELIASLLTGLMPIITALLPPIMAIVSAILSALIPVLEFVIGVIVAVVKGIVDFITWLVNLATSSDNLGDFLLKLAQGVIDFFAGIQGAIGNLFAGAINWLFDIGRNIVQGLINGVTAVVQGLFNLIGGIGQNIADTFANVLGIHSPSRLFRGFGKNVIKGLEIGLAGNNRLDNIMGSLSEQVAGGFSATLDAPTGYRASSAGGNTYKINVSAIAPNAEVGRAVVAAIDDFERVSGRR